MKQLFFDRKQLTLILGELEGRQEALCKGLSPPEPDAVYDRRREKYRIVEKIRQALR